MKSGYYVEWDLVGYGGRDGKKNIDWFKNHLKKTDDHREMLNIKIFLVAEIK